jgi:hypothetical protein
MALSRCRRKSAMGLQAFLVSGAEFGMPALPILKVAGAA